MTKTRMKTLAVVGQDHRQLFGRGVCGPVHQLATAAKGSVASAVDQLEVRPDFHFADAPVSPQGGPVAGTANHHPCRLRWWTIWSSSFEPCHRTFAIVSVGN